MDNVQDIIRNGAAELQSRVVEIRRHLHSIAELSFEEVETSAYIAGELKAAGISFESVAGTGLIAHIEGLREGASGNNDAVVLRADIDALPIEELSDLPFKSKNRGVMHACGHDVHAAVLLATLLLLNSRRELFGGNILGLFQPGEELCPGGASLVLKEKPFDRWNIKAFIGEHVAAELFSGQLGLRAGQYMASSDEIRITVHGRGGHAALPHTTIDPITPAAQMLLSIKEIAKGEDLPAPTVVAIGKVMAEGATNIIPSNVYMEGTMRTFNEAWRAEIKSRIRSIAADIATENGATVSVDIADGYPCVFNNEELTSKAQTILSSLWGEEHIEQLDLRMTAEDFGFYTELYPSLFYRLGVKHRDGSSCGLLHNANFNPDESGLSVGIASLSMLAIELLNSK